MTTLSAEVAEAVRLRDAATPGSWAVDCICPSAVRAGDQSSNSVHIASCYGLPDSNAALIAAAPQHVDLIERLFSEIERLTACLQKANDQGQDFEREWYLRGDEIERLHARVRELIEGKDYGPFERQINDLQMQNANCVKENLRLRAELEQARADIERLQQEVQERFDGERELLSQCGDLRAERNIILEENARLRATVNSRTPCT